MRTLRTSLCLVAALSTALSTSAAWSQAIDPAVEAMLRDGIAHRVAGRDEAALARFEAAYHAQRAPVTAGQLALACQAVGRWVDADRYMREALASPDDDWVRRHRRELDAAYAVVRQNVGALELRGGPDGAAVRVDGVEVGRLPLAEPLRVRAGVASLEVRAEGYLPWTRQVTVLGDERTVEPVALREAPREAPVVTAPVVTAPVVIAPPPRATEPAVSPRVPWVSWVLGGVGAAFVAGGAVSIAVREASADRFNQSCPLLSAVSRDAQSEACRAELSTGDWTTAGAITGFVGGAALLGVGVLLAVLPRRHEDAPRAWSCAPGVGGVACAVRF